MSENKYIQVVSTITKNLHKTPANECKEDLTLLIQKLVRFIGESDPTIFQKGLTDEQYMKKFFKIISSVAMDVINPFKRKEIEAKMNDFKEIFPLIQKYAEGI